MKKAGDRRGKTLQRIKVLKRISDKDNPQCSTWSTGGVSDYLPIILPNLPIAINR
jgi:hypothetical protein